MAGSSLLTLLDDIATLLDDVAVLSKVAAKKTAGVLGDDLALNAEQVSGIRAERELPVVWAVFKGSAINKAIMVPIALLLSVFAPWTIMPLLMIGGAFLCYEGFEKVSHRLLHKAEAEEEHKQRLAAVADDRVDMVEFEKGRIRGAIRTDAILSAEIIVIVLGTVQDADLTTQIAVLSFLAVAFTVGVYGLVAGIVKMDDLGVHLIENQAESGFGKLKNRLGAGILRLAPRLMSTLSIAGTIAMFLVGGGILVHGVPMLADGLHSIEAWANSLATAGRLISLTAGTLYNGLVGFIAGGVIVGVFTAGKRMLSRGDSVAQQ